MKQMKQPTLKSKNLYESIGMQHPDGTLMCMTSSKKAKWYLNRGLASRVNDKMVRLNFTPNGYGHHDNPYFLERKGNLCVVCGNEKDLTRHHVVPYQFRTLFTEQFKSHDHHDVLLVCRDCHDVYEREANELKKQVYKDIGYNEKESYKIKHHNKKVISARDIIEKNNVPKNRLEFLKTIADKELMEEKPDWKELFIAKIIDSDNINEFCSMWRKHFIDHMNPKYISEFFDVNHNANN